MIQLKRPERLLFIAIGMMLFGCIMPFLMVLKIVESTFLMNFLSFIASTFGMFLGIAGVALYRAKFTRRTKNDNEEYRDL